MEDATMSSSDEEEDVFSPQPTESRSAIAFKAPQKQLGGSSSTPIVCEASSDETEEDEDDPDGRLFLASKKDKLARRQSQEPSFVPPATAWRDGAVSTTDRKARMVIPSSPYVPSAEQQEALDELTLEWQANLQRLLFWLGADAEKFTLKQHQFASALLCAGIVAPWPPVDLTSSAVVSSLHAARGEGGREDIKHMLPTPTPNAPGGRRSGCLLGDVMGMGKTVSAISGILLREFVALLEGDAASTRRSSLIVAPNDMVMVQWIDHLKLAGIHGREIMTYVGDYTADVRKAASSSSRNSKPMLRGRAYPRVVIITKYRLSSDMANAFDHRSLSTPLAPLTTAGTIDTLHEMWDAKQKGGKGGHKSKKKKSVSTDWDAPAKLVAREAEEYDEAALPWLTVVIDEVHDLRNAFAKYSMGGLLACQQARRAVLLSGTPFNNNTGDLITIGSMIDASSDLASYHLLEKKRADGEVAFPPDIFLRRGKDELLEALPEKHVDIKMVVCSTEELHAYEAKEAALEKTLRRLIKWQKKRANTPVEIRRKRRWIFRLGKQFLAQAHPARMAIVHPVLPGEKREVSRLFSPSRREMKLPAPSSKALKTCACCKPQGFQWANDDDSDEDGDNDGDDDDGADLDGFIVDTDDEERLEEIEEAEASREGLSPRASAAARKKRSSPMGDDDDAPGVDEEEEDGGDDEREAPDEGVDVDEEDKAEEEAATVAAGSGGSSGSSGDDNCPCGLGCQLVPAPSAVCGQSKDDPHFLHQCCLDELLQAAAEDDQDAPYPQCSRCQLHRSLLCRGCDEEEHEGAAPFTVATDVADANDVAFGGLKLSSKMIKALELLEAVPAGDKAIVFSWFKGALDLFECVLQAKLGIAAARIDGDMDAKTARTPELDRFKKEGGPRVLLLTLSSGGVGLNIAEANHCIFLDGWWNPAVIEQAIDRTHRIGQKKEVHVHLLIGKHTFDEVIQKLARKKGEAALSLLGDKESEAMLGGKQTMARSGLSQKEYQSLLTGIMEVRAARLGAHLAAAAAQAGEEGEEESKPPVAPSAEARAAKASAGSSSMGAAAATPHQSVDVIDLCDSSDED